jgi:hypothetical protein
VTKKLETGLTLGGAPSIHANKGGTKIPTVAEATSGARLAASWQMTQWFSGECKSWW